MVYKLDDTTSISDFFKDLAKQRENDKIEIKEEEIPKSDTTNTIKLSFNQIINLNAKPRKREPSTDRQRLKMEIENGDYVRDLEKYECDKPAYIVDLTNLNSRLINKDVLNRLIIDIGSKDENNTSIFYKVGNLINPIGKGNKELLERKLELKIMTYFGTKAPIYYNGGNAWEKLDPDDIGRLKLS